MATKDDIVRLSSEIKVLEARFESKLERLEDKLTIKLGGILIIGIGIIIALGYFN